MTQNRRLPWIIAGVIALVFLCAVCIIGVAIVSPMITNRNANPIISLATQVPRRLEATPVATVSVRPGAAATPAPLVQNGPTATPLPTIDPNGDVETQIYTRVYAAVNPSVVAVRVLDSSVLPPDQAPDVQPFFFDTGEGSGFVIDTDGHIITNNHVIENATSVVVQFYDGVLAPAEIVGSNQDTDLAVLKVDPQGLNLQPVTLGSIDDLKVGERVIVIGNPFGNANTMTTGIISALGRQIAVSNSQFELPEIIQTDAAINPGNSGGPMLNANGEVIGVAFMLQSTSRSNSGIGFGIPVYFVDRVAKAIISQGQFQHPWLGIRGNTLSPFIVRELNLGVDSGVLVAEVIAGSPSDKAGLQGGNRDATIQGVPVRVGGDIIVAIDGQPVVAFDDLLAYLGRYTEPGMTVTLTLVRNGQTMDVPIKLEARPQTLGQ